LIGERVCVFGNSTLKLVGLIGRPFWSGSFVYQPGQYIPLGNSPEICVLCHIRLRIVVTKRSKIFGPDGAAMSPTHTRKAGRLYRYYISQSVMKQGANACPVRQIPAAEIERIVIEQIRSLLQTPEIIVQTWRAARKTDKGITETEVRGALLEFEPIWNELFPAEQARIVQLLVERVDLQPNGIDLRLRIEGLTSVCSELRSSGGSQQEAA
jgi:site-specific DNA recombinase